MTMHKGLHPRDDVDGLYVSRKEWGRGLASIKDSVDASIQRFEGVLFTSIRNDTDNTMNNRNKTWEGKQSIRGVLND